LIGINYGAAKIRDLDEMNQAKKASPLALLAVTMAVPAAAQSAGQESPDPVTPYADIRYRLELVDQEGLPDDAAASTLRIRAGVKTAEWQGFSALVEGEAIAAIGARNYNDTVNGKVTYPVVADPTDLLERAPANPGLIEQQVGRIGDDRIGHLAIDRVVIVARADRRDRLAFDQG
jgi:hypothetical protein